MFWYEENLKFLDFASSTDKFTACHDNFIGGGGKIKEKTEFPSHQNMFVITFWNVFTKFCQYKVACIVYKSNVYSREHPITILYHRNKLPTVPGQAKFPIQIYLSVHFDCRCHGIGGGGKIKKQIKFLRTKTWLYNDLERFYKVLSIQSGVPSL